MPRLDKTADRQEKDRLSFMYKRKIYIIVGVVFACMCLSFFVYAKRDSDVPHTYEELLAWPVERLGELDIARMNLLCATGLPGSEDLDVEATLAVLDEWGELAKSNERKYKQSFVPNIEKYERSYALFLSVYLGFTLKEDLNCKYSRYLIASGALADMKSIRFFKDSRDLFLNCFVERQEGTCASFPVLMVAIGRRCEYPLYVVSTKGHLFCRWDDGNEKMNLEVSCKGVDNKKDLYYKTWPFTPTEQDIKYEKFFVNMTPEMELCTFLDLRGSCLMANKRYEEAFEVYKKSLKYMPNSRVVKWSMDDARRRMNIQNMETKK